MTILWTMEVSKVRHHLHDHSQCMTDKFNYYMTIRFTHIYILLCVHSFTHGIVIALNNSSGAWGKVSQYISSTPLLPIVPSDNT